MRKKGVRTMEYNFPIPCGVNQNTTITVVGKPIDNFYILVTMDTDTSLEVYKMEVKLHGDGAPYIRQSQPMVTTNAFEEPYVEQCPTSDAKQPILPDGKPMPLPPTQYGTLLSPSKTQNMIPFCLPQTKYGTLLSLSLH